MCVCACGVKLHVYASFGFLILGLSDISNRLKATHRIDCHLGKQIYCFLFSLLIVWFILLIEILGFRIHNQSGNQFIWLHQIGIKAKLSLLFV